MASTLDLDLAILFTSFECLQISLRRTAFYAACHDGRTSLSRGWAVCPLCETRLFPCGYSSPSSDYVARYVPDGIGSKFNPHVSIGIATQEYLDRMLDEGFEPFTFSPVEVAVYHLGNLGIARKRLMSWELTA